MFVAEEEKQIVGYCIVYCVLDEAEIAKIAVCEKKRHEGVGRRLLEKTEQKCLEQNIARMLLEVRESNVTARNFIQNRNLSRTLSEEIFTKTQWKMRF